MEAERWAEIKRIVNACLEVEPSRRQAHAAALCGSNADLISEVQSWLRSYDKMGDFLAGSALTPDGDEHLTGQRIGHYQLCELIAEGGMGIIYRAVRSNDFEKLVA